MNQLIQNRECVPGWQAIFGDVDAVQIILYLRKYNPNVNVSTIIKNLLIDEDRVIEVLNRLTYLDAVEYSKTNNTWALTCSGRNVADCLMELK